MPTSPCLQQPGATATSKLLNFHGLWESKPHGSSFSKTRLATRYKVMSEEIWQLQFHNISHLKSHPYSGQLGSLIQGISFKPWKGIIHSTPLDGH